MMNLQVRLLFGFVFALMLTILPVPELLASFRPPWVLLYVLYIEYFIPRKFKLTTLLFVGLLLDVLLSTVIGEHSFALLSVTWLASSKSRRFQFFSISQQIFLIGFFCFMYQSIIMVIDGLLGFHYSIFLPLASASLSMLFWPWIRLLADGALFSRVDYR
jgi:rod shape-determining protein MreD